jgi:hypothetical protein
MFFRFHHFRNYIHLFHIIVVMLILVLPSLLYPIVGCSERGVTACDTTQGSSLL